MTVLVGSATTEKPEMRIESKKECENKKKLSQKLRERKDAGGRNDEKEM